MIKIIFLAIYNETSDYIKMYQLHKYYLNYMKHLNLKYYFIIFKNLENLDYLIDEENYILYINGTESFIPGILDKTIKAFDIIHNKLNLEYDFIFRTNISSFVHFENVFSYLKKISEPKKEMYYIGPILDLQWIDIPSGIIDKTYWKTVYCSGTCIILSNSLIKNILDNREKIHYNIIDDVSIGHYVSQIKNIKRINISSSSHFSFEPHKLILNKKHLCYMNNFNKECRQVDIKNLKKIIEYFMYKEKMPYKQIGIKKINIDNRFSLNNTFTSK